MPTAPTRTQFGPFRRSPLRRLLPVAALACVALIASDGCARSPGPPLTSAAPGEPLILPEHYAHSIAALGMSGAHRAFQVGHGSVVGNGDAALEWRIHSPPGPVRVSPVYFERDGVPVAHWWMVSARESVHFEAAAVSRPALGDTSLMLSVLATVIWLADTPGECALEVRVRARADDPGSIPWDVEDSDSYEEYWRDRCAVRNGRIVAGIDPTVTIAPDAPRRGRAAVTRGFGPGALAAIARVHLGRGERKSWHFWMPAYPSSAPGPGLERISSHARIVSEARDTWRRWLAQGSPLTTSDSLVDAAWRAALVTLIVCQERERGDLVPLGNPFQYRDVWLRDAARTVRALAVAGYPEMARSAAWTLRRFQLPSGVLMSQRGQLDGTGQSLWAFAQAATIPPAPEWAARMLPTVRGALSWFEVQCLLTRQLKLRFEGLLPFADPRDNELTRAQLVGNDAWGIAGCRAAATLARLAGDASLASSADSMAQAFHDAFHTALARTGSRDIPPSWQGVGRDWGNLVAGYPTRVLSADDPRLATLARRIRARAGGSGLVSYGPLDTLHTYLGTDLAQWALLAGHPAEARAYLADLLAHSSSTLGQAELFERASGSFGTNLPPHATAAATLVDLVRNMIVCDSRDTLELALGGDVAWWRGARFEHAATRFGVIDVALESPASDRRRARWTPVAVPTRVRVPDGEQVLAVVTPGARAVGERWVECPPRATEVEFRVVGARVASATGDRAKRAAEEVRGGIGGEGGSSGSRGSQ